MIKDDLDLKDIYLRKDNEIIGLHSIGYADPYEYTLVELDGTEIQKKTDFMPLETWGNRYNENYEMVGGSFRVHQFIEDEAKEFEADG
jgi:hypothetical protein